MVGAGVFALMGVAATMAGSAVWISFLAAGIIALLTGHSFAQLGVRYPSRGGVVEYLARAYRSNWFSGGCSILFYIAQLIGMAMIALAFGKFASKLIGIEENALIWGRVLASSLILILSALSLVGSDLVGRGQKAIVLVNMSLLAVFTVALSTYAQESRLAVEAWPAATPILSSLALTFFAYTGFAVISNTAEDMENPARDLPRAMYISIISVTVLYVALALAVVGSVGDDELRSSGAMLLAIAARENFGEIGYVVLLISAVAATATCLNGGIFGVTNITFRLAERGQLPERFKREIRASTRGLTISAVLALLMVNFMSLTEVASLGSATSLFVYSLVNYGAFRLIKQRGVHRVLIVLSVVACVSGVLAWVLYTLNHSPHTLFIFVSFLIIAFVTESLFQRFRERKIRTG
jgi:amino acid transporter